MKSNLDITLLESCAQIAKDIHNWLVSKDHPEHYKDVADLEATRNFIHVLDLLETVLVRFEISTFIAKQIFSQDEPNMMEGSLLYEFGQIDIEEYFASNLLEFCHQLSHASKKLKEIAKKDKAFVLFTGHPPEFSKILLARHMATHFVPNDFENHEIAQQYSILRRPYQIVNEKFEKQLARSTMPRVTQLIKDSVTESYNYLTLWRQATIG